MFGKSFQFGCVVLLLSLCAGMVGAQPLQQDGGAAGLVSVEAEHFDDNVAQSNAQWEQVGPTDGFTGVAGMQVTGLSQINTGYAAASPRMDYQVNFVKTGTHYIWIRGWGAGGGDDSCHAGLDGEEIDTCDRLQGWNLNYTWSNSTMDGVRSTFEVDAIGVHTFNIYMREDGFIIDKIVLTTDPDYTPTDDGPPESLRGVPAYATVPHPADGATDVRRDVVLGWMPGPSAVGHDVYFGTSFISVYAAGRSNPMDALAARDQSEATFDPAVPLEFGQTYFWRIDEVSAAPAATIVRGNLWTFTAEPFVYPVRNIVATASSSDEGATPQSTVDGSGLDADDLHSIASEAMWVSSKTGPQPAWIQYEFDRVYKLREMWVWNYNVQFESVLGFGFKDVTIEYSLDGSDWVALAETEFTQGLGREGYAHDTTVDFAGAAAKYVRLTAGSNWGGLVPQFGLSEVRFFFVPAHPREPMPATEETGVGVDAILNWRPGREAASHEVYFDTDRQAVVDGVALVDTVATTSYDPGSLEFGRTYYWKIVEVNEAETPSVWEGDLWSFSTQEYLVVDDFESYTDEEGGRIYETWVDGWTNGTGSVVGYLQAPFAERTIVNGGKQSMPLEYNNVDAPYYSEAERTWPAPQDWTISGADTLLLHVRGNPTGYVETPDGVITMSAAGVDIWNTADEFTFAHRSLNGDGSIIVRVDSVENTDPWAKVGVMIRNSLDPGARNAMAFVTADGRVGWQWRQTTGGNSDSTRSEPGAVTLPHWVRLTRTGDTIRAEHSADGAAWQPMVEAANPTEPTFRDIAMSPTVYVGLALTSHSAGAVTTAQFAQASGGAGAWQFAEIGIDHPLNARADLYLALTDDAGHTGIVKHPDPEAVLQDTWQPWPVSLADFSSAGVDLTAVETMSIGVGDRTNPTPDGAGRIFIDDIGVGHAESTAPGQ